MSFYYLILWYHKIDVWYHKIIVIFGITKSILWYQKSNVSYQKIYFVISQHQIDLIVSKE